MNILFLNPPFIGRFSRTSRSPAVTKGGTFYYPIWLAYAAGVAEKAGHNIRLYDAPAQALSLLDVFALLHDFKPDMAVIDTSTPSIYSDVKVAEELKAKWQNMFCVLVGTHPSALPAETLNLSKDIDAVVVGEYDYTVVEIADSLSKANLSDSKAGLFGAESDYSNFKGELSDKYTLLKEVKGLAFRDRHYKENNDHKDKIIINPTASHIKNLDDIPFVSSVYKKYLNINNYFFAAANYPMIMIMTGRGCPYKCFFCVYPQVLHGRFYRVRSPKNVVDEIEYIINNFPKIKEIGFEDDCFTANPNRVEKICDLIIERGIKIKWYCNVRGNLSFELLKLMKQAGCRLVTVGFESGCQHILDNMNKGEKVTSYYEFVKNAKKAKILVHGCIMTGNPGDSRQTLKESYEFAEKIDCDSMQFYPLYVYPGTEAYHWAKQHQYLQTEDFSKWLTKDGLHNCVIDTPTLSSEEMVLLCDKYLKKYHLRPKYIFRKLLQALFDPTEGYRSIKSAKIFFGKLKNYGNKQ